MEDSALESTIHGMGTRADEQTVSAASGLRKGGVRNKNNQRTASTAQDGDVILPPPGEAPVKVRGSQQRSAKKRVFSLLAEVKVANQNSYFVQALGAFREAANLSQGVRSLREIAFDTAVEEAECLLPENWRVAQAFLNELSLLDLDRAVPNNIEVRIHRAAHDEAVTTVLNKVKQGGDRQETRDRLKRAIRLYPGERVLETHLNAIDSIPDGSTRVARAEAEENKLPNHAREETAAATVEPSPIPANEEAAEAAKSPEPPSVTGTPEDLGQTEVLAQIKALLETGPLSEAEKACNEASRKFPHSPALWVLATAIREKADEVRHLLEKGEEHLAQLNLRAARESFLQASTLVPLDHALRSGIADKLYTRAWTELGNDWRSSEALLALSGRISPGRFVPPDLAQALAERKWQVSPETPPAAGPEPIPDVEVLAYAETTSHPRERRRPSPAAAAVVEINPHPVKRLLKKVATYGLFLALLATVVAAVAVWRPWERASRKHVFEIPPEDAPFARSHVPVQGTTGTLTVYSNVDGAEIFIDTRKYAQPKGVSELALNLPPATYLVHAVRPGYEPSSPVVASVLTGINREVHVFLSPKLVSPEALRMERQDWERASGSKTLSSLENFAAKYPASAYLPLAEEQMQEIQWTYVDPNDPQVLEAFLSKYPNGSHGEQAREQLQILNRTKTATSSEQDDWVATNKSDKAELEKYLVKYPSGAHAAQAMRFVNTLDRWSAAALRR